MSKLPSLFDILVVLFLSILVLTVIALFCFLWTGDPLYGRGVVGGIFGVIILSIVIYKAPIK